MSYRKNAMLHDAIQSDPTAGLPLFDGAAGKRRSKKLQHLLDHAPRAMNVATETRSLAHATVTFDKDVLGRKQRAVYEAFVSLSGPEGWGSATNQEVADHLGLPINRVVGRTFELRAMGFVVPAEKRQCARTGMVVQSWKPNKMGN